MTTINDVCAAYEEAKGRWAGCNWSTHCGILGLDLDSISSGQAQRNAERWQAIAGDEAAYDEITVNEETFLVDMAAHLHLRGALICLGEDQGCRLEVRGNPARRFCAESLAREWEFASVWLTEIESDAHWADEEAQKAVSSAEDGDWQHALAHASQACMIEGGYDAPRPWRSLKKVIERLARQAAASGAVALEWDDDNEPGHLWRSFHA
jgi:hypothetical protein